MEHQIILFGSGFLLCVLWMDLKFDSLVWRRPGDLPDDVLTAIAAYYNRVVPTDLKFFPLIAIVMVVTILTTLWQVFRGGLPLPYRILVPVLAWPPILLAMLRIVPGAAKLGERTGTPSEQSDLARTIFRGHLYCFGSIASLGILEFLIAWKY